MTFHVVMTSIQSALQNLPTLKPWSISQSFAKPIASLGRRTGSAGPDDGGAVGRRRQLPDVAAAPSTAPEASSGRTGTVAAVAVAGAITLGGAAWLARRRWAS